MPEDPKKFLQRIAPHGREERWCFTEWELKHPEDCWSQDPFVANLGYEEDNHTPIAELGVVVERNGTVTDRWEDGTRGVLPEFAQLADDVETLYKPVYYGDNHAYNEQDELADAWRDVLVSEDGRFKSWAPVKAREALEHELLNAN